jgi:hypothetical protein
MPSKNSPIIHTVAIAGVHATHIPLGMMKITDFDYRPEDTLAARF